MSVDSSSVSTSVATPGNEKWVSLFAKFARALSDPRLDGNSVTVYFVREESFTFDKVQGAEAPIGTATRPALGTDKILLADIQRLNAQTQILNANISTTRRELAFKFTSGSMSVAVGTPEESDAAVLSHLNDHINDATAVHAASAVSYAGSPNWADASAIVATNVEAAIDEVVTDLANQSSGQDGARRVGYSASQNWADSTTIASTTVHGAIDEVITDLAATSGAPKIGAAAINGYSAGTVRSQLDEVAPGATGTTITARKTFNGGSEEGDSAIHVDRTPTSWSQALRVKIDHASRGFWRFIGMKVALGSGLGSVGAGTSVETLNATISSGNWVKDTNGVEAFGAFLGVPGGNTLEGLGLVRQTTGTNTWTAWTDWLGVSAKIPAAATTAMSRQLCPKNLIAAWALLRTDGAGGVSIIDGFNVASVAIASSQIELTFAQAMANATYVSKAMDGTSEAVRGFWNAANKTTTVLTLRRQDDTGATIDLAGAALDVDVVVVGLTS